MAVASGNDVVLAVEGAEGLLLSPPPPQAARNVMGSSKTRNLKCFMLISLVAQPPLARLNAKSSHLSRCSKFRSHFYGY